MTRTDTVRVVKGDLPERMQTLVNAVNCVGAEDCSTPGEFRPWQKEFGTE
jgi:hypothetical protein